MLKSKDNTFRNYDSAYDFKIVIMSTILINLTIRDVLNNLNQRFIVPT
jgi:hypothetical protein